MSKKNQILNMMSQLQQSFQDELSSIRVSASSGGGMVSVEMDGLKRIISLKIDPEIMKSEDIEMLQDLIIAAINEAARQVDIESNSKVQSFMSRLPIGSL